MIIINTTFILDPSVAAEALAWVKDKYSAGIPDDRRLLTRILAEEAAGGYALHLTFDDMDAALAWDGTMGEPLRAELTGTWGEKALAFRTFLEAVK